MARRLVKVWWERGGRVSWRYEGGRMHTNRDLRPADEAAVRGGFAAQGVSLDGAEVIEGRVRVCPRCNGRGFYQGGPCFRCYGNAPASWERVG